MVKQEWPTSNNPVTSTIQVLSWALTQCMDHQLDSILKLMAKQTTLLGLVHQNQLEVAQEMALHHEVMEGFWEVITA